MRRQPGRRFLHFIGHWLDRIDRGMARLLRFRHRGKKSFGSTVIRWLLAPFVLLLWAANAPVRFIRHAGSRARRDLLLGLPAAGMVVLIAGILGYNRLGEERIDLRYRKLVRRAMDTRDFELANTIYGRLVTDKSDPRPADQFGWLLTVNELGDSERAMRLLNQLAPDQQRGYLPAHRLKAQMLASRLERGDESVLDSLKWHLEQVDEPADPQILFAWSQYYQHLGDPAQAAETLKAAAELQPEFMAEAAQLMKQAGRVAESTRLLRDARMHFKNQLAVDVTDFDARLSYSRVLLLQRDYAAAEQVLLEGFQLQPRPEYRAAISDAYLRICQSILNEDPSDAEPAQVEASFDKNQFGQLLVYLQKAIAFDVNRGLAYQLLVEIQTRWLAAPEQVQAMQEMLQDMIAQGRMAPLAHVVLGSQLWMASQREEAIWNLRQACRLNEEFAKVLNNLAVQSALAEPQDLDFALQLARLTVEEQPQQLRYRSLLANIQMQREQWNAALEQFQHVVAHADEEDLALVHRKLARIYQELNRPELANQHQRLAEQAATGSE